MTEPAGSLWPELKQLLLKVERPSRYLGGEFNSPAIADARLTFALAYPDVYEIGVSNLGLAILQEVLNSMEDVSCERVYSPWTDMEALMRAADLPLFTLETHRPVSSMDVFGISLPHELTYTNVLNLIDLAGLPLLSEQRDSGPIVIAGGCGAANPEPLADFFDLVVPGEAEERIGELAALLLRASSESWDRGKILEAAGAMPGIYRPAAYRVSYHDDGTVASAQGDGTVADRVKKSVVDIEEWSYPRLPIVPHCEAVHDRMNVELFRGCTRGCRFCQAGMIYRPVRERSPAEVARMVRELAARTGYEEISLCSLSSADYSAISKMGSLVGEACDELGLVLSLPSLRMDSFSVELSSRIGGGSRGGLTFAPEAGSERLRHVINKPLSESEMAEAVLLSARSGRRRIKLYFMIGLPTETDEDVEEIAALTFRLREAVKAAGTAPPAFNISVSTFVPKAQTPFQRLPQESKDSVLRKQEILKRTLRGRGIKLSWHDAEMSEVEGLLARGDRRVSAVIENAWRAGARFDSWSDCFSAELWERACEQAALDRDFYLYRQRGEDEVLPWAHVDFGLDEDFLREEFRRALAGETTPDCRYDECAKCGVCESLGVEISLAREDA